MFSRTFLLLHWSLATHQISTYIRYLHNLQLSYEIYLAYRSLINSGKIKEGFQRYILLWIAIHTTEYAFSYESQTLTRRFLSPGQCQKPARTQAEALDISLGNVECQQRKEDIGMGGKGVCGSPGGSCSTEKRSLSTGRRSSPSPSTPKELCCPTKGLSFELASLFLDAHTPFYGSAGPTNPTTVTARVLLFYGDFVSKAYDAAAYRSLGSSFAHST